MEFKLNKNIIFIIASSLIDNKDRNKIMNSLDCCEKVELLSSSKFGIFHSFLKLVHKVGGLNQQEGGAGLSLVQRTSKGIHAKVSKY